MTQKFSRKLVIENSVRPSSKRKFETDTIKKGIFL